MSREKKKHFVKKSYDPILAKCGISIKNAKSITDPKDDPLAALIQISENTGIESYQAMHLQWLRSGIKKWLDEQLKGSSISLEQALGVTDPAGGNSTSVVAQLSGEETRHAINTDFREERERQGNATDAQETVSDKHGVSVSSVKRAIKQDDEEFKFYTMKDLMGSYIARQHRKKK